MSFSELHGTRWGSVPPSSDLLAFYEDAGHFPGHTVSRARVLVRWEPLAPDSIRR